MTNQSISQNLIFLIPTILVPIFFLPIFTNFFTTSKAIILLLLLLVLILTTCFSFVRTRSLTIPHSPLTIPLILIIATTTLNLIINPEARLESILAKGLILIILPLFALFMLNNKTPKSLAFLTQLTTTITTLIFALFSLAQVLLLHRLTGIPDFLTSRAFTPAGSPFAAVLYLLLGFSLSLPFALSHSKTRYLAMISSALSLVAIVAYISLMLPSQPLSPQFLPYSASWSLTLDAAKNLKHLIFGLGFANFTPFFTANKPLFLNTTSFWNVVPETSGSELLNLLITGGVLVFLSFIYFLVVALRQAQKSSLRYALYLCALALIIFPGNIIGYTFLFCLAGIIAAQSSTTRTLELSSPTLRNALAISIISPTLFLLYPLTKTFLADYYLRQAQLTLLKNSSGQQVYEHSLRAAQLAPNLSSYRVAYSQVNLSLASAISQQTSSPTDQERAQIAQLVSQAIREAKAATALRPSLSSNWQNLSSIYRNLIGIADQADQFALEYLQQAVVLDPANPALRLEYGGLLSQLAKKSTDQAEERRLLTLSSQEYQTAINLKPDYANAYYNQSQVQESLGNKQAALTALQSAIAYLPQDSSDYQKAKSELETLKNSLPAQSPSPTPSPTPSPSTTSTQMDSGELTGPSPLPTPINDPIVLPEENPAP